MLLAVMQIDIIMTYRFLQDSVLSIWRVEFGIIKYV